MTIERWVGNKKLTFYEPWYPWITCHICGKDDEAMYIQETMLRMTRERICFSCLHWVRQLETRREVCAVINGTHYRIGAEPDKKQLKHGFGLGFGGSPYTIRYFDGRVVKTRNLWCQGDIPAHFRSQLPDDAEFVREPAPSVVTVAVNAPN